MALSSTPPWHRWMPVVIGVMIGAAIGWQFRGDTYWEAIPFALLSGVAGSLIIRLILDALLSRDHPPVPVPTQTASPRTS